MSRFLPWLFEAIKRESRLDHGNGDSVGVEGALLYNKLPFYSKFTGDGAMFLWDLRGFDDSACLNVAFTAARVCHCYVSEFLPLIRQRVSEPPTTLRVGLARGRVLSVGNGNDYVGPCINIAARLQKTAPGVWFCLSRHGFSTDHVKLNAGALLLKSISVRGVGDKELVYVLKSNYDTLKSDARKRFADP